MANLCFKPDWQVCNCIWNHFSMTTDLALWHSHPIWTQRRTWYLYIESSCFKIQCLGKAALIWRRNLDGSPASAFPSPVLIWRIETGWSTRAGTSLYKSLRSSPGTHCIQSGAWSAFRFSLWNSWSGLIHRILFWEIFVDWWSSFYSGFWNEIAIRKASFTVSQRWSSQDSSLCGIYQLACLCYQTKQAHFSVKCWTTVPCKRLNFESECIGFQIVKTLTFSCSSTEMCRASTGCFFLCTSSVDSNS